MLETFFVRSRKFFFFFYRKKEAAIKKKKKLGDVVECFADGISNFIKYVAEQPYVREIFLH